MQAADIDDIVQEVAIRALRDLERFTSSEHMIRWCCRVAINLHIDVTRKGRKLSAEPLQDTPARHDVAEAVEDKLVLDAVLAHVAGLSADDQRLLLDRGQGDTRKESVRLAVRRHRLRARLAAMVEGTIAGIAVLRRVFRSDSAPARVALLAIPVAAVVVAAPLMLWPRPTQSGSPSSARNASVDLRTRSRAAPAAHLALSHPTDGSGAGGSVTNRPIVEVGRPGMSVAVRHTTHEANYPTFCASGYVNLCVDRPGPEIPKPKLPPLPLVP